MPAAANSDEPQIVPPSLQAPAGYRTITEGTATVLFEEGIKDVFYNPVQVFNRDLSIAAIRTWQAHRAEHMIARDLRREWKRHAHACLAEGAPGAEDLMAKLEAGDVPSTPPPLRILEALAASGLRSVRYAKELSDVHRIVINDVSAAAVRDITRNLQFNGLDPAKFTPHQGDAVAVLAAGASNGMMHNVIDLDPYGTASPFIEGAVSGISAGGLLCVTCTDMQTLAGNMQHAAFRVYGCQPARGPFVHEQALRMLLGTVALAAARHKRAITPLLSVSAGYYVRCFIQIDSDGARAQALSSQMGMVYSCNDCNAWSTQPFGVPAMPKAGQKRARAPSDSPAAEPGAAAAAGAAADASDKSGLPFHGQPSGKANPASLQPGILGAHGAAGAPSESTLLGHACALCGGSVHTGGPLWLGRLHDQTFVRRVLHSIESGGVEPASTGLSDTPGAHPGPHYPDPAAWPVPEVVRDLQMKSGQDAGSNSTATLAASRVKLQRTLACIAEELPDTPMYWSMSLLSKKYGVGSMPNAWLREQLLAAGHAATYVHPGTDYVKTTARAVDIHAIMLKWIGENEAELPKRVVENPHHPASRLRASKTVLTPSGQPVAPAPAFASAEAAAAACGSFGLSRAERGPRYAENPRAHWGPKAKAR